MVANISKTVAQVTDLIVETSGDILTLRNGKTEDFHLISPNADSERMRTVGVLGEMLYEQVKKTFGTNSLLIVAQNEDFKLVMFPRKDGFAVWKTDLDLPKIVSALGSSKKER